MNYIKILGSYGAKSVGEGTTCIQVTEKILIDAGNIINPLGDEAKKIEYVFLTHSHIDHILDLPFLIDLYYADQEHTLQIFALQETIDILKKHIFNFDIYPDFSQINLQNSPNKALNFNVVNFGESYSIDGVTLMPVETNHTVKSCGYIITKEGKSILFSSDTYINDNIWDILNKNKNISTLITEVSFPSYMDELAKISKHYTPKILSQELKKLKRNDLSIYLMHLKPNYIDEMLDEIKHYGLLKNGGAVLHEGYIITYNHCASN
jgi:ribonuclease BN (tRNA processing enzyme)